MSDQNSAQTAADSAIEAKSKIANLQQKVRDDAKAAEKALKSAVSEANASEAERDSASRAKSKDDATEAAKRARQHFVASYGFAAKAKQAAVSAEVGWKELHKLPEGRIAGIFLATAVGDSKRAEVAARRANNAADAADAFPGTVDE